MKVVVYAALSDLNHFRPVKSHVVIIDHSKALLLLLVFGVSFGDVSPYYMYMYVKIVLDPTV